MPLRQPVSIYTATSSLEAHVLKEALQNDGIRAYVTEDNAHVGSWHIGITSMMHRSQVWVEEADAERASDFVRDYEERQAALQSNAVRAENSTDPFEGSDMSTIEVVCEECGTVHHFDASLRGTIQPCAQCHEFLDVEEPGTPDEWTDWQEVEEDAPPGDAPAHDED